MYKLITPPAALALSLTDAKAYLDITKSNEDALITGLIKGAILQAQEYCWLQFINAVWMKQVECMPGKGGYITLGKGMVSAVASVVYNNEDGTETTLDSSKYILDSVIQPARLIFKEDAPASNTTHPYVRVTYTVGYGASDTDVPQDIKDALALMVIDRYDNRTDERPPLPKASERALNQYRYKYFSF